MAGRIFVTGDTHGHLDIQKVFKFGDEHPELDKEDYLIICGDFGVIWHYKDDYDDTTEYYLKALDRLPFTTLWLDGNHENFNELETYPMTEMFGCPVRKISNSVFHLERGYVYIINNKKIFILGGATSIDKKYRTENESWWPQENIMPEDIDRAHKSLARHNHLVDYVMTHCAPTKFAEEIITKNEWNYIFDFNEAKLDDLRRMPLYFKKWFCGHYHEDYDSGKFCCLYNRIIEIKQ